MAGQPIEKFSAGSVHAAIWENELNVNGRKVKALKATLERRYKDASGGWKSSSSLGRTEIPLAMLVLQRAFEYIIDHPVERSDSDDNDDDLFR